MLLAPNLKLAHSETQTFQITNNLSYIPTPHVGETFNIPKPRSQNKKSPHKGHILQCVEYGKQLTGHYGSWGDGGHKLSLNSDGEIGDVVIFRGTHVGVVIARVGSNLTISEANWDYHGSIRTRLLNASSVTIKGFHSFN